MAASMKIGKNEDSGMSNSAIFDSDHTLCSLIRCAPTPA
jgi:hypothetical protein